MPVVPRKGRSGDEQRNWNLGLVKQKYQVPASGHWWRTVCWRNGSSLVSGESLNSFENHHIRNRMQKITAGNKGFGSLNRDVQLQITDGG